MDIRLPYLTSEALAQALEKASRARQSTHHQEVMQQLLKRAKECLKDQRLEIRS